MGLGLALGQRLAQLHGGHVSCESKGPQLGATFRVYLPFHRDARPPAVESAAQAPTDAPALRQAQGLSATEILIPSLCEVNSGAYMH